MTKDLVEVKSEFDAEFRRFSIPRVTDRGFLDFCQVVENIHHLSGISFVVFYTDPVGDLLPITNNDNFKKALATTVTLLRLTVQRKDENWSDLIGYSTLNRKKEKAGQNKILAQLPLTNHHHHSPSKPNKNNKSPPLKIGMPEDFRQVSAIIDVDKVPQHHRRVRLLKHGSDKPLGFYIRDGVNIKVTPTGLDKIPGIFISRLVAGGLAESTGLISVNDEIVEVNGIEVQGKTLDQVTDMMIANSCNLIITVKPANQRGDAAAQSMTGDTGGKFLPRTTTTTTTTVRNTNQRMSQMSVGSTASSGASDFHDDDDMDEVRDLTGPASSSVGALKGNGSGSSSGSGGSDRTSSKASSTASSKASSTINVTTDSAAAGKRKRIITNGQLVTRHPAETGQDLTL
ncbi:Partitioning defective 6-like protein gamma [Hypsibius exemplaris]|uniref:Partitioning defective 6-like protein gamma n=1 Tax=Hypsibius exemplaris TaxID=2072580 RepID=A0A1W0WB86_HYPEX|nr:Partitioning defective 6-like protein gamma [Hypsibius exemplaris]